MAADVRRPSLGSPRPSLENGRPPGPHSPSTPHASSSATPAISSSPATYSSNPTSSSSTPAPTPPYYILLSHSGVLAHAPITYHYADDPALALLPETPDEHVVLLDWSPGLSLSTANTAAGSSTNTAASASTATTASPTPFPGTTTTSTPVVSPAASTPSARIAHSEATIKPEDLVAEKISAHSLSPSLAVTGVRVEDVQSHRMYVVETTEGAGCPPPAHTSAEALVARFKQRNVVLQRVLDYPSTL
ncbi:hypothetical protein BD626DRAFT_566457 [Schizophyllum amplum]|uniref:Uncharacterized protein n=1 Tax=Schizophyllum amplum TaxID=97359 RepID=A0A550CLW3_9AGAR|nr:hypothetical protein BD626DRAFT_566457 [Auriculariopsis ampla]